MRCKAPFFHKELKIFCPCGKCVGCLINRRRKWTLRITLENNFSSASCFVTLTYSPEHLPKGGNLNPRDLTLFWKRLRKQLKRQIRYFACGEYGERFGRPHYHAIIFGLDKSYEKEIEDIWGLGNVLVKETHTQNIEYVAGYVTKKITNTRDNKGRVPEFSRASRRPAIGVPAVQALGIKALLQNDGQDVLHTLNIDGKPYPVDKLLKQKMREAFFSDEDIKIIKSVYTKNLQKEVRQLLRDEIGLGFMDLDERSLGEWASSFYAKKYEPGLIAQQKKFLRRFKRDNEL